MKFGYPMVDNRSSMMMGVGDYGSTSGRFTASTGSTTTATSDSNPSGGGAGAGVRRVRLARPPAGASAPCAPPTFGFSVRGGREHSTGFFVSHVEPASEAYNQGLKVNTINSKKSSEVM